jgi:NADH-quinone oxidoreductase subunit M
MGILSIITWIPLVGAVLVLLIPKQQVRLIQGVAILCASLSFVLSWNLLASFDHNSPALQFVERYSWIPEMGMTYALGVDGLSFPMVLLTTLLMLISVIASVTITERVKAYYAWFMLLEFAVIGVFEAQDWFLFYMFWEITLIPMFFLIGVWGGEGKGPASMSFFLYTLGGSVFMLLGIIAAYLNTPTHTFDMVELVKANVGWSKDFQIFVFLAFFLGLAVKIPVFPVHGWLPLAHVEAPVPVSVILSGILLKMGGYGLMRISELFPVGLEWFAPFLFILGLVNIVYGSLMAWRQTDLKAMVAFSSISHMGFVALGVSGRTVIGFTGALYQMFAHGVVTGALFLLVGVIYDRTHTRQATDFGGLSQRVPIYSTLMSLALLASMGLPGLGGFIGEFHALVGAFQRWGLWVAIASIGILVTAAYSLRTIGQMFTGQFNPRWADLKDMNGRELVTVLPLAVMMIGLGLFPSVALVIMDTTLTHMVAVFK